MDLAKQEAQFSRGMDVLNYTLKQLTYVEAAGRLGSISKAAIELAISQSSITAAIDAVEHRLGYDLFIRTPARGIRPTPQGALALSQVRVFIEQARHFEAEIHAVAGDLRGTVRLACYATAAPAVLPPILRDVTEHFPEMTLSILEGSIGEVVEYLDNGEADLAFCYGGYGGTRHDFQSLFEAPPFAIVPRGDPLARKPEIRLAELAERPLVMLDLPGAREYFLGVFAEAGLVPRLAHFTRSSEILRSLVGTGFGVSILNIRPLGYHETEADYAIVPIKDAITTPVFGVMTHFGVKAPGLVSAFIGRCMDLKKNGNFEVLKVISKGNSTAK
jgi:DNA-binding transcriptional LysR family regulator